jgi:DNA-binding transcriptional LysR family regulator
MNNLKNLPRLLIFAEIVKQGSFTAAAESLGMTVSGVSQQLSQLEKTLGVRLLNRSTRVFVLTDTGQMFLRHCNSVINQLSLAMDELQEIKESPQGILSITAPHSLETSVIVPAISQLCKAFPNVHPRILIDDQWLDPIKNNLDVMIRLGELPDSNYLARKLGVLEDIICASPAYLAQHSPINCVDDLKQHLWIATSWQQKQQDYIVTDSSSSRKITIHVSKNILVNTLPSALGLVKRGLGIAMLPRNYVTSSIKKGRLLHILPELTCKKWPIYALHAYHGAIPVKVKYFIELLDECINK